MRNFTMTFLLLLTSSICMTLSAQSNKKIDSLTTALKKATKDTSKAVILSKIIDEIRNNGKTLETEPFAEQMLSLCTQKLADVKDSASKYVFLRLKAKSFNAFGSVYYTKGDYEKGIQYHRDAISIQEKIGAIDDLLESYHRLGNSYRLNGRDYDQAMENYRMERDIAIKHKNKPRTILAYAFIASVYQFKGDYQQALANFRLSLKHAEESNDARAIANSHSDIGTCYKEVGDYKQALTHTFLSLRFIQEWMKENNLTQGSNPLADRLHNFAALYYELGNYPLSLHYALQALKIREQIQEPKGAAIEKKLVAGSYYKQKNYRESLKYLQQSLEVLKNYKDVFYVECYLDIGQVYLAQEKYGEAKQYTQTALALSEEYKTFRQASYIHLQLALIFAGEQNIKQALDHCAKSMEIINKTNDKVASGYLKATFGEIYMQLPDSLTKAKKNMEEAASLFSSIGRVGDVVACYEELAEIEARLGNYKNAHETYKHYTTYKDSLMSGEVNDRLVELRMQYDFDKKADSMRYQQQLSEAKLDQQALVLQRQQQDLVLKGQELALSEKEKALQRMAYLKAQADLNAEQSQRQENEKQLIITKQEKGLQQSKLDLQATQLELQNKELSAKQMQRNIFVAGSILLFFTAFFIYRNFQNQRKINQLLKTSAEKEKIELQLQSLRSQLNPHFMFNSLNAIQELIVTEKNELSQSYLERFAQLLRNLLENANQPFISLRQELQFLELYLSLESLRIPDLDYKISVDPKLDLDNSIIPNMMLQPYVENALWHGLQHKMGHKALQLTVYKRDEALHYEIRDNGVGREKAGAFKSLYRKGHNSKGMELLSKRFSLLSQEYGRKIQVEIKDLFENKEAKGTAVTISVPTAMMETSKMSYA